MKFSSQKCLIVAAVTGCLFISTEASGQVTNQRVAEIVDPVAEYWLGQASRTLAAERGSVVQDIADPAFDVYVAPGLIGKAYEARDAALLTDVALQLAEGERVLLRSRQGITAAQAIKLALNAASHKQDKNSLQRLARYAASRNDKSLAEQVAAAEKLTAVSRDTTSRMMVPIEEIEFDDYAQLRHCVHRIDQARLTGDTRCLIALEQDIQTCVPDAYRGNLSKMIAEARAAIPEDQTADEKLVCVLNLLTQISRDDEEDEDEEDTVADEPVEVSGSY